MFMSNNERRPKSIKVSLEGLTIKIILSIEVIVSIKPNMSIKAREFFTFLDEKESSLLYLLKDGP